MQVVTARAPRFLTPPAGVTTVFDRVEEDVASQETSERHLTGEPVE